jgi:hypothetical protein
MRKPFLLVFLVSALLAGSALGQSATSALNPNPLRADSPPAPPPPALLTPPEPELQTYEPNNQQLAKRVHSPMLVKSGAPPKRVTPANEVQQLF